MTTQSSAPINLLSRDVGRDDILAAFRGERPSLLPPLGAPEWAQVAANPHVAALFAPLRELALREVDVPLPVLSDALYLDYVKTGTRINFEPVYFERRRSLGRAAIGALLGNGAERDALLRSMIGKLTDIFNETSWSVPAHVRTSTGRDPLFLDLFSCETANLMAEMVTVFGAVLPIELAARIRERLRYTIFENFATHPDRHWWYAYTNNWNAVCHQGIVGAALAVETDVDLLARVLLTAKAGLPHFLEGFGDDGGCSEGPGYWGYGFGWFAFLNEQLETASSGKLSLVEGNTKVRECAAYAPRARFSNGYLINFSDGPARASINPAVLGYLGKRLGLPSLVADSQTEYRSLVATGFDPNFARLDFFYLARVLLSFPADLDQPIESSNRDYYFPDLEVVTARRTDALGNLWEFAAKGGHNCEHHNHNDCGSYILHVNGEPIVTEIGAPEYNAAFFGPTRYQNIAARTLGHSLPIVNGVEQAEGPEYKAVVLSNDLGADRVGLALDLTGAYVADAHAAKLSRVFELDALSGSLTVVDAYALSEGVSFETAICTNRAVEPTESGPVIVSGSVRVRVDSDNVAFSTESHSYNDHRGQMATITRIVLTPLVPAASGAVKYTLRLDKYESRS